MHLTEEEEQLYLQQSFHGRKGQGASPKEELLPLMVLSIPPSEQCRRAREKSMTEELPHVWIVNGGRSPKLLAQKPQASMASDSCLRFGSQALPCLCLPTPKQASCRGSCWNPSPLCSKSGIISQCRVGQPSGSLYTACGEEWILTRDSSHCGLPLHAYLQRVAPGALAKLNSRSLKPEVCPPRV